MYRVCDQRNGAGRDTVYMQQKEDIYEKTKKDKDPRKEITQDIKKYVTDLHQLGHWVVLAGDINENMKVRKGNSFYDVLEEMEMILVTDVKHEGKQLPATYDRGNNCIDIMAISKVVPKEAIKKNRILTILSPLCNRSPCSILRLG